MDGAWFSEVQVLLGAVLFLRLRFQTHPLDLNYPEFYERRKESFEERLRWLARAEESDLRQEVESIWEKYFDVQNSEIVWNLFKDVNECTVSFSPFLSHFPVSNKGTF